MSRLEVDRVMREQVLNKSERERFVANPEAYIKGRNLTDKERAALIKKDWGTLYSMGAHPLLLFEWSAFVVGGGRPETLYEFMQKYKEGVAPHGYVDFTT